MASTVWRGYITFGLISIPIRLFRAARAERVSLKRLYRPGATTAESDDAADDSEPDSTETRLAVPASTPSPAATQTSGLRLQAVDPQLAPLKNASVANPNSGLELGLEPVRQAAVRADTEEVLPTRAVVKGYEFGKGKYVALEPDELKSLEAKTASEMQIDEFVKLPEVDPIYFETSYYVVPEEAGEKAYALLYRALQTTGLVAVAQFAMHSREHVVILRSGRTGMVAHTMFFNSEVRADQEAQADIGKVSDKELKLAEMLIHSLAASFQPEKYHDTYRERLEALIAQKVAGAKVEAPKQVARKGSVVNIADALQKSLAALKKPAASTDQPAASKPVSQTPKKRAAHK